LAEPNPPQQFRGCASPAADSREHDVRIENEAHFAGNIARIASSIKQRRRGGAPLRRRTLV
jgi:hypothetical protein